MNSKKVYIDSKQYNNLVTETLWAYHYGKSHDLRPYVSDNKYQMAGRSTGHFGSGTYFSTYSGRFDNKKDKIDNISKGSDNNPRFIEIGNGLYRVDLDLYKNLYRVWNARQGDVLYTLCANLNHMANRISYMGRFYKGQGNYSNSDLYQKIKANADGLGLKCPSYYELIRMIQRWGSDDKDIRSFSTVFMEYNGYNGVNVSGVDEYDNTLHGSVIYDLSKVNSSMEEIQPKNLYTGQMGRGYDKAVVKKGYDDYGISSLEGDSCFWLSNIDRFSSKDAIRLLKNYASSGNIIDPYYVEKLDNTTAKRYLRLLFTINPYNFFGHACDDIVSGSNSSRWTKLIESLGAYYWVNYVSEKGSVLINLLNEFEFSLDFNLTIEQEKAKKKDYLSMLMGYMSRDLTDYEKEFVDEYV